jgi:ABC-2 type transport system permease protein
VIAFIVTLVVCFVLTLSGYPLVLNLFRGWLPEALVDLVASLSFLTHFQAISKGVLDLRDIVYFVVMGMAWLYASAIVIDMKKAD